MIRLLTAIVFSLAAIGSGEAALRYYSSLDREAAYYAPDKGDAARGVWWGKGAEALGLTKPVESRELRNLLRGLSPDGERPLVQLQKGHQPGWDVTGSSFDKSVDVMWAVASSQRSQQIELAKRSALLEGLSYMEENVRTRRGKGGKTLESCGLVVALVQHAESRAGDPQLHTHCLILNLALRKDGTFGALRGQDIYTLRTAAAAVYRAAFARGLRALGLELAPSKDSFRIAGVPRSLCDAFSTRRKEIEAELERTGTSGAKASEKAALRTRPPKSRVPFEERLRQWRKTGLEHGFGEDDAERCFNPRLISREVSARELRGSLERAATHLANERSSFTRHELLREALRSLEHRGPPSAVLLAVLNEFLSDRSQVLPAPPRRRGEERFSPPWLIEAERSLLSIASDSRGRTGQALRGKTVERTLKKHDLLSLEQQEAVRHATLALGSIQCIRGIPGTGKTTVLRAVREAHEAEGWRVVGSTLAARAARELEKGSGVESDTVARTLRRLSSSPRRTLLHHARQLARAAKGKPTWKLDRMALDKKTVLVIDEAAMVGTPQLEQLIRHAARAGAKTLLVGDNRQLQSVEAGGGFAALCRMLGTAELTQVVRQRHGWMREAVRELAQGDIRSALSLYAASGRVSIQPTKAHAAARLVADWATKRTQDLKDTLILAGTRNEASMLNLAAQESRRRDGVLGAEIRIGNSKLHAGDRVLFTSNHRGLKVSNGDLGVLERVHALIPNRWARVTVRLDREDDRGRPVRVSFTPSDFNALELGYAVTTHRAQGASVEKAFVLGGGWIQDRELGLVQLSRHRDDAQLYLSEQDAGPDLTTLAQSMSRTRQKEMALSPLLHRHPLEVEHGC